MQYEILEDFLISAIKDCSQVWRVDTGGNPFMLCYLNNKGESYSEVRFTAINFNELAIDIKCGESKIQTIVVNVNKVPQLMEYLTNGQLNFQMQVSVELGDKFTELDSLVNNALHDGIINKKKPISKEDEPGVVEFIINEKRKLKITIHDISHFYINLQAISIEANFEDVSLFPIKYKKLISLNKVKKMPFLSSLSYIPTTKRAELSPNIDRFMKLVANMDCENISSIAKKINLSHNLDKGLEQKKNIDSKNKGFKL